MDHATEQVSAPKTRKKSRLAVLMVGVFVAGFSLFGAVAPASANTKISEASADSQLNPAGVTWSASGGCRDRYNGSCTAYDQINQETVSGVLTFKRISGCAINITGGTETGHANGTYSHWEGYKVDESRSTCIDNYIYGNFAYQGLRSDGAPLYKSASGNLYANEGSHWDILYYTCGC